MAFQTLPGLTLTWNDVTLAGGDSFQQWNVYRLRTAVDTTYTRIAVITSEATRTYTDYNVASGQSYTYEVTVTALRAGTPIESSAGTVTRSVTFAANFLHQVNNPANYLEVKTNDIQTALTPDVTLRKLWGRKRPTAFVGEQLAATFKLVTAEALDSDYSAWNALVTLFKQQRDAGAVFCYRPRFNTERWFVALVDVNPREDFVGTYAMTVDLAEVDYDEAV